MIYCTCKTAHWHTVAKLTCSRPGLCSFAVKHASVDSHLPLGFHSVLNGVGIINHCHPHMGTAKPLERCKSWARQRTRLPASSEKQLTYYASAEVGRVMSLKGCLHAVLSGCWGTGCHCKTKPMRLNITLTPWQALGGLPLQIEGPGPPPQLKRKWLTISLLERNKQAVCWDNFSTAVDQFV